jgi:uncharacterized protein (TIGR03792 family)
MTGSIDVPDPALYRYVRDERRPVEILVFRVDPADVDEFLRVDHEVWTLGEAATPGLDEIPLLAKEVWLNDARPGEITIVIEWPSIEAWDAVDDPAFQRRLTAAFDGRFGRPYELVRAIHDEQRRGIHRWSRFEPVR